MSELQVAIEAINPTLKNRELKRICDLIGATLGLIFGLPLLVIIAILIKITSPGPVLFRQKRLGKDGQPFEMYKFRSMVSGAEELLGDLLEGDPHLQRSFSELQKIYDDPRQTSIGRFLRRTSLDELPQLLNVIKGDMSLVGPRPILLHQRAAYGPNFLIYQRLHPGITGLWQVSGRNLLSFRQRAALDEIYIKNWSLNLDLFIMIRTIWVVIRGEGTY